MIDLRRLLLLGRFSELKGFSIYLGGIVEDTLGFSFRFHFLFFLPLLVSYCLLFYHFGFSILCLCLARSIDVVENVCPYDAPI